MRGQRPSIQKFATLVSSGVLVLAIAFSAFLSADSTVFYPRQGGEGDPIRRHILPIFPQSWPFFTKPPNDPEYVAYALSEGRLSKATDFPNSRVDNAFGLSRDQRAQGPEIANVVNSVPGDAWIDCISADGDCVLAANEGKKIHLVNNSTFPTLCGTYVFAETEPVAWDFRAEYTGWRLDIRTIKVELDCEYATH